MFVSYKSVLPVGAQSCAIQVTCTGTQSLLLILYSEFTPGNTWGTRWGARDGIQFIHVQPSVLYALLSLQSRICHCGFCLFGCTLSSAQRLHLALCSRITLVLFRESGSNSGYLHTKQLPYHCFISLVPSI